MKKQTLVYGTFKKNIWKSITEDTASIEKYIVLGIAKLQYVPLFSYHEKQSS